MGEQVAAGILGGVAQLGEHLPCKQGVKGSNPFISTEAMRIARICAIESVVLARKRTIVERRIRRMP